ncbi:hypothetical protein [Paenibacillus oleatilyticus]|uniref:hypothetical protein n=1 Tax=Paenibacillus oleatilyticus TaxID=2594886 RepID=UPI001C1F52B8|nr:hypothetical protein [Paenibacillus oleatilyticus]MBU7316048.1 hypothetical protein [Paenibacillus oleatilyticus]
MNWTKERLDEIETNFVNNPYIDKAVLQQILLDCVEEIRRLYGYTSTTILAGRQIRITGSTNEHEFEIGQIVTITEFDDFDPADAVYGVEAEPIDGGEHWFVRHGDYEFVK